MSSKKAVTVDRTANLRLLCSTLLAERDQLRKQVQDLQEENGQLKKSLGSLLCEEIPVKTRSMLAASAKEPELAELIAELEEVGQVVLAG